MWYPMLWYILWSLVLSIEPDWWVAGAVAWVLCVGFFVALVAVGARKDE